MQQRSHATIDKDDVDCASACHEQNQETNHVSAKGDESPSTFPLMGLIQAFGLYPLLTLTFVYFIAKGIVFQIVAAIQLPLYKDVFKLTHVALYQRLVNASTVAWSLKPLIGIVSDWHHLGGYRRRGYMMLATLVLAIMCVTVAVLSDVHFSWIPYLIAFIFFIINFCVAALDLLAESKYSEMMVSMPAQGSLLVSCVWGTSMIGNGIGAILEGPVADAHYPQLVLILLIPLVLLVMIPFVRNWLGETKTYGSNHIFCQSQQHGAADANINSPPRANESFHNSPTSDYKDASSATDQDVSVFMTTSRSITQRCGVVLAHGVDTVSHRLSCVWQYFDDIVRCIAIKRHSPKDLTEDQSRKLLVFYGILMSIAAIIFAFNSLMQQSQAAHLTIVVILVAVLGFCSFLCLPKLVAAANIFMFLKEALYIQIPGALDFWFTADERCVPGGPHFSYFYYQTVTAVIGSIAGLIGVMLFHNIFAQRSFRVAFLFTTLIKIFASLVDWAMVTRINIDVLGISDKTMYFLGDAIVFNVCYMLDFMPAVALIAKLCPKGLETTMYALLAGFSNFGQNISRAMGAALIHYGGIVATPISHPTMVSGANGSISIDNGINYTLETTQAPLYEGSAERQSTVCDFTNLPNLVIFAHCLLPMLVIPLTYILVPDTNISAALTSVENAADDAKNSTNNPTIGNMSATGAVGVVGVEEILESSNQSPLRNGRPPPLVINDTRNP